MSEVLAYNEEMMPPWWARFLMRPVGWVFLGLQGLASLWILWEARLPENVDAIVLGLLCVVAFGVCWIVRLLLRVILWKVYHKPWREFWRGLWWFGAAILGAGILLLLGELNVPERIAFRASELAMQREAEVILAVEKAKAVPAAAEVVYPGKPLGAYEIIEIRYLPRQEAVVFFIRGAGFLSREGWAYVKKPVGATRINEGEVWISPVGKDWHRARITF
jgi:hypothetical protein